MNKKSLWLLPALFLGTLSLQTRGVQRIGIASDKMAGITVVQCAGTDDTTALNAAIALGGTVVISKGTTCAASSTVSFPSTVALAIDRGGLLKSIRGQTVTIAGPVFAGPYQIFTNATASLGTVSFAGNQSITNFFPQWWGAVVDGSTLDTPAWVATIAAAYTVKVATIKAPAGISMVSSISLPAYSSAGQEGISITIEGVGNPPIAYGTVPGTLAVSTKASVIKSTTASTAGVITCGGTPFQAVSLTLRNLIVRREDNPAGPTINGANLFGLYLDNVGVDTGRYTTSVVQPTLSAGIGVIFPGVNNAATQDIRGNSWIQGYYTGLLAGEHLQTDGNLSISACAVGVEMPVSYHAMRFARLSLYNNVTNIKVSGASYFHVQELDIEHANGAGVPAWQTTIWDIDDASNLGRAKIRAHIVKAFVGVDSTFTRNGGFFITVDKLQLEMASDVFVRNSANISIPNSTATTLSFNTVDENTAKADLSNKAHIKPSQYGVLTLSANVSFEPNATGTRTATRRPHTLH